MDHSALNTLPASFVNEAINPDYSFEYCGFVFKQVNSEAMNSIFYTLVNSSLYEVLKLDQGSSEYRHILDQCIELDRKLKNTIIKVIAFDKLKPIATICAYLDSHQILPCEIKENLNLVRLRQHANIMELGRFTVMNAYRHKTIIGLGLFKYMFEVALTNNIDLLIESAFKSKIAMFKRIGLDGFNINDSYDQIYKLPKTLLYFNFAESLFAYFNGESMKGCPSLSNYSSKLYSICNPRFLNQGYHSLLKRNRNRPNAETTYMMKFNNLLQ